MLSRLPIRLLLPLAAVVTLSMGLSQSLLCHAEETLTPPPSSTSSTSALGKSRLNSLLRPTAQVYLPAQVAYGRANPISIKAPAGRQIELTVHWLSQGVQAGQLPSQSTVLSQQVVQTAPFDAEHLVQELTLPELITPKDLPKGQAPPVRSVLLEAKWLGEATEGVPLGFVDAAGQNVSTAWLPVVPAHNEGGALVIPSMAGMDPASIRGLSTMAEFAADPAKKERLQYDGGLNTNRVLDRNPLRQGGSLAP